MSFVDFKKDVLTVSGDLRQLLDYSKTLNLKNSINLIDDSIKRVESNSFSVAVVGEFKRGKSTFINALLGQEILPTDILPTTATLNRVTYGLKPMVNIIYKDGRKVEVPVDQLINYVTKLTDESEKIAETVKEAIVYSPIHYCMNNVDIIDTPGLNDDENMTNITLSVLPQVDAAIMVVMALAPFSEFERSFLETKLLSNDLGRVIFVVTRIDHANTPGDADRAVKEIENRIRVHVLKRAEKQYGVDSPEYQMYQKKLGKIRVYGLSSYQALQAKTKNDPELLTKSRFTEFETSLEKFLTEERGAIFLQVPVNRIITTSTEILQTIKIRESALRMKQEEFQAAYEAAVSDITDLRKRKTAEMSLIDSAAEGVRIQVLPLLDGLENELQRAAIQTIDAKQINPEELKEKEAVQEKLARAVSNAIELAIQRFSEQAQNKIQFGLTREIERLSDFTQSVNQVLSRIEMRFSDFEVMGKSQKGKSGEGWAAAISLITGWGGIWSGYREGGVKGAFVGAGVSFGVSGLLLGIVGLPITWPVIIAVGLLSAFTGGWLTRKIFGKGQVENFKENLKKVMTEEISKQLQTSGYRQKVNDQITETFYALKNKVHRDVDSILNNTENTLVELRGKRERDETLTETEQKELHEIRQKTQAILDNAQRINEEMYKILSDTTGELAG
jgi:GTPase Era involved in 16S rRNA processing